MIAKIQSFTWTKCSTNFFLFFLYFLAFVSITNVDAATIIVGPPPASIQTAINSASAGDTVQLSNGTYIEEILINKNLTLNGNGVGISVIQCPTTPTPLTNSFVFTTTGATYHPFVMAQGATNVTIQNLTIDGNSQPSNFLSYRFDGIGYHNAGGTIQNVHATNVEDSFPGGPTQHGFAIAGVVDDSNPYTINVLNCTVDRFQKAGIDMRGNTLTAVITGNTVTGETPPSTANANGIVIQFGTQAIMSGNTVTNLKSTVVGNDSVGILLSGAAANSSITNNTSNDSDLGIYSANAGNNLVISNNTVNNNGDLGIYVQDTNGLSTLENNILTDNVNYNMYLIDTVANESFQLGHNQFIGSQNGLGVEGNVTTGPVVSMNTDSFTGTTGYFIQEINAPNDIWPSTATVSFNGLISGHITFAQYTAIRTQILDQRSPVFNPSLGLVLDFIIPTAPTLTSISPTFGPDTGGTTVTITGSSFTSSDTQVFFGAVPGTSVVVVSDTTITVTAPAGVGVVDVTVVTPFGTTPITSADQYTYISAPLPPTHFRGVLHKNKFLNRSEYLLQAKWHASPSPDVVAYRIYKQGHLVETVSAGAPLVFRACLNSKEEALYYTITAVNSFNVESIPVTIRIVNE
jgi:parallel beta-helix repeat protein